MNPALQDVCCASLPPENLAVLAELRCQPDVRVLLEGVHAWVLWPKGADAVRERVLAVPGVALYVRRAEAWYRLGSHLPAFGLPVDRETQPLYRVLSPAPMLPRPPEGAALIRVRPCLVPAHTVRRTTAMLCALADLAGWAEGMPAGRLESIRAARLGDQVLLLGRRLPPLPGGERFWGKSILVPIGRRVHPDLPENALRESLRVAPAEIVLFRAALVEAIPQEAFEPLGRARIRLAINEWASGVRQAPAAGR